MQLINTDGIINLELITDRESFSFNDNDLAHTPLIENLKKHSDYTNLNVNLSITSIEDNSFILNAKVTGKLIQTCGRCIREFQQQNLANFEEILLYKIKSSRLRKQEAANKKIANTDYQHLDLESNTFVQEINSYKFNITQWLYENIIIAIAEEKNLCTKTDCEENFQKLLKTTQTEYNTTKSTNKPNTHKVFADLLKPLKKH